MGHKAHVWLVNAHTEGDGGHHDDAVLPQEAVLVGLAHLGRQARVVGQRREAGVAQRLGQFLHAPARLAIDHAGITQMLAVDEAHELRERLLLFLDAVADVGPVEAADELPRLLQPQALHDVGAREAVGRGGERDARHARVALVQHGELAVLGPEVVPPLAHAMRLVDGKQRQLPARVQAVEQTEEAVRGHALGRVLRDVQRRLLAAPQDVRDRLQPWLDRAERIRSQRPKDKHKLYALHAPQVECIGKGKARQPYEFGVKVSVAVTAKQGLMVGARSLPGNPYDGHTLAEQLEQTTVLLQDLGVKPHTAIVDLGYRGADADIGGVTLIHRGKSRSLTRSQRRWLKRRQAVEPAIGHAKHDHGMKRCWLKGAEGDALHAVLCAAGFNIRWLLRAIARRGIAPAFLRSLWLLSALAASAYRLAARARPALLVGAAR